MLRKSRFIQIFVAPLNATLLSACAPESPDSLGSSSGPDTSSGQAVSTSMSSGTTGASECEGETEFIGDLLVDDATDLSMMHCFVRIDGSLVVGPSASLTSPLPFASLREVTGDLHIIDNAALTSTEGLEALESVKRRVMIEQNDALISTTGLEALAEVGGFEVHDNVQLVELRALAPSVHVLDNGAGFATFEIGNLPSLADLSGLSHVTSVEVDGWLRIIVRFNDELIDIAGLSGFFFSEGSNVNLQLFALPALAEVRLDDATSLGELDIARLDGLSALRLDALESARSIEISETPVLADLSGLGALSEVTDVLSLGGCNEPEGVGTLVSDLTGLGALAQVGLLEINGQPLLTTLDGLSTSVTVEDLTIRNNAALPMEVAQEYADTVDPADWVSICGNMGGAPCVDGSCPIRD